MFATPPISALLRTIRLTAAAAAVTMALGTAPHLAAAASNDQATSFIKDVRVVSGSDPGTPCPSGYTRDGQDLNQGSGGSYVFACYAMSSNPGEAIQELYVNVWHAHLDGPNCQGDDQVVDGDLNDGVTNGFGFDHEGLNFCIHRAGTSGRSGQNLDPVARTTTYFPARPSKRLTGLSFVAFTGGNLPQCVSNDCVDSGVGGFGYLEYAVTAAPYCQQQGSDWFPLFRPYQSQSDADMTADLPTDAQAFNLNAGSPTAAFIYACGRFQPFSGLSAEATTQPANQPYVAGTWTNQNVIVQFTCNGTSLSGQIFGEGANQMSSSLVGCTDGAGQPVPALTFGPINIDKTAPSISISGGQSSYTLDQTVSIQCSVTDVPGARGATSGANACSSINVPAYAYGPGHHDITVSGTDVAGNSASTTASFDVQVTVAGLASLTNQLLSASDPPQTAQAVEILNAITTSPIRESSLIQQFQSFLNEETSLGGFPGETSNVKFLIGLSGALPPAVRPFTVNDNDPTIRYTGSGWRTYTNRPFGDLNNDVHATMVDGDSASLTFAGTGISYVTERSIDCGPVDVVIDGVLQTTVNAQANVTNQANQTLYSIWGLPAGQHTITITKRGNTWMLLDAFIVQTTGQTVNDTDTSIQYSGNWGYYSGRPGSVGDLQQDVHATVNNGDAVAYTFNGTGIAYITEKSADEGQVDVYLDGALQQTVNPGADSSLHNLGGQVLFSRTGLASGQHVIELVKKSGTYMLLDGFTVAP